MKKKIMSIFTRTPLHVGAGNSVGAIDAPIMRERHTRIPIIPGSSLKGVLADLWNDNEYQRTEEGKRLFGNDDAQNACSGKLKTCQKWQKSRKAIETFLGGANT
ncbi:MAG: RAMP superfamily CRISPR-associated protein [Victivallaceae bacterium]|nr:RAMP superfamily CRISPR-associated protein [Victivallaceae bacterium]